MHSVMVMMVMVVMVVMVVDMMLIFTTWIFQSGWIRALCDVGTGWPVLGPGAVLLASHVVCRQIEVVNPSVPSRPCVALVSCN